MPDVNDAEDNHLMTPSENYDKDLRATVSYVLTAPRRDGQRLRVADLHPAEALAEVAAGLQECVAAQPENYQSFTVHGYPEAIGYTEEGDDPADSPGGSSSRCPTGS